MNARSLLVLFVVGLIAFTQAGPGDPPASILRNGSFEDAGESSDQADAWSRWGQWINREDSWTPTHSGKCLIGYHHWQIEKDEDSVLWQDVTVESGKKYTFSVFAMRDDPKKDHGAQAIELRLESTKDDKQTTIAKREYKVSDLPSGSEWKNLSVTGVSPTESMRVLIRIVPAKTGPRGGAVKLDDALLTIAAP